MLQRLHHPCHGWCWDVVLPETRAAPRGRVLHSRRPDGRGRRRAPPSGDGSVFSTPETDPRNVLHPHDRVSDSAQPPVSGRLLPGCGDSLVPERSNLSTVIRFLALVMQIMCTLAFIRALFMNTRSQVGSTCYRKSFIATSVFGV